MSGNNQEKMPVFLINGFLEAGKTQFISFTLQQEYFQADGVTVLILCEEGDTEYDQELLKKTRTRVITVDSADELTFSAAWKRSTIRTGCSSNGTGSGPRIS